MAKVVRFQDGLGIIQESGTDYNLRFQDGLIYLDPYTSSSPLTPGGYWYSEANVWLGTNREFTPETVYQGSAINDSIATTPIKRNWVGLDSTYTVPWSVYRNKTKLADLNGFAWRFDLNQTANNDLPVRMRRAIGATNRIGRYCTPNKAYLTARTNNGNDVWCPLVESVNTYFGSNLDDETLSPYIHHDTYAAGNRVYYLSDPQTYWLRMAQESVLEYIFGTAIGDYANTGKRVDGTDSWVLTQHLNLDPNLKVLCHDSIGSTGGLMPPIGDYLLAWGDILESEYGSLSAWWASYAYYLGQFQQRIIQPRGLKLAGNCQPSPADSVYFEDIADQLDILIMEYYFSKILGSPLEGYIMGWDADDAPVGKEDYLVSLTVEYMKYFIDAGKGIVLGDVYSPHYGYLTCASGTGYITIAECAPTPSKTRSITIKQDAGADKVGYLANFDTMNDLSTWITEQIADMTLSFLPATYNDHLSGYENPYKLLNLAEATVTTTGINLEGMGPSRYYTLTLLCLALLAGADRTTELYLNTSSSNYGIANDDLCYIPLGYKSAQSNYAQYPGTTTTNQFYRYLVIGQGSSIKQAVAVLNWETTALTINAGDFGVVGWIDPMTHVFDSAYVGGGSVGNITLPPHCGTVLLVAGV